MARPARKYIIIPEYKPLYAMSKCFGPQHGPLKQPTPTPISIIGELLRQTGGDKLTIMEVLMNPDGTTTKPVELTLANYNLPYEEILGGKKREPGPVVTPIEVAKEAVKPVIKNKVIDLEDTVAMQDTVTTDIPSVNEDEATTVSAEAETEQALPPEPGVTVTTSDGVEVEEVDPKVKPYSQMSKKERREARRKAAAEAAAQQAAEATDNNTSIEE